MRGLGVSVYRSADVVDCTNGGVSSRYATLNLFDSAGKLEGYVAPQQNDKGLLVMHDKEGLGGYIYAVPAAWRAPDTMVAATVPDGHVGWMFGGNYVATSDSRFSEAFGGRPIPVHDRSEDYELYRSNCD